MGKGGRSEILANNVIYAPLDLTHTESQIQGHTQLKSNLVKRAGVALQHLTLNDL